MTLQATSYQPVLLLSVNNLFIWATDEDTFTYLAVIANPIHAKVVMCVVFQPLSHPHRSDPHTPIGFASSYISWELMARLGYFFTDCSYTQPAEKCLARRQYLFCGWRHGKAFT